MLLIVKNFAILFSHDGGDTISSDGSLLPRFKLVLTQKTLKEKNEVSCLILRLHVIICSEESLREFKREKKGEGRRDRESVLDSRNSVVKRSLTP